VKIAPRDQARFLQSAAESACAVLFYGPDAGQVSERAEALVAQIAGDAADPFRVAELSLAQVKDDPALLADEAAALSLSGGRRVLRLRNAGDPLAQPLADLFAGPPPAAFLVLEAGELGPRSALRSVFERGAKTAAIACYLDDEAALKTLITASLKEHGLSIEPDALEFLLDRLGADRAITRSELEKLALYASSGSGPGLVKVTLAQAEAVVGDSSAMSLDDLVFAFGDGDGEALDRAYDRALAEGNDEIMMLRACARHLLRLAQVAEATDPRAALKTLRPPVFFKFETRFLGQSKRWTSRRVTEALLRLQRAEFAIKTGAQPKAAVAEQALFELASTGAGRRI
jgi:DNA polymerase-3 subunit delta